MDMQTRTAAAYEWPAAANAIPRDIFHRDDIYKASGATGNNYMVKGMRLEADPYTDSRQNDELQCVVFWNAYRRAMGMGSPP